MSDPSAQLHGPGGLLATPGLGVRRKRWGRCTCATAQKEQLAPGVTRIRGNLCNVHGRYGPCDPSKVLKPNAKKPKKGRAAAKPKKTDAQRAAERDQKRQANIDAVTQRMADSDTGIAPGGVKALQALSRGEQPSAGIGKQLADIGLMEQAQDGSFRMTPTARAALNAMAAGDYQRTIDAISRATDQAHARQDRQAQHTARQQVATERHTAAEAKRQAAAADRAKRQQAKRKPIKQSGTRAPAKASTTQPRQASTPRRSSGSGGSAPSSGASSSPKQPKQAPAKAEQPAKPQISQVLRDAAGKLSAGQDLSDNELQQLITNGLVKLNKEGKPVLTAAGQRATMKAQRFGGKKRSALGDDVFAGPDRSFPIVTAQDVRDAVASLGRTNHDKDAVRRGIIRRARAIGATDALPDSWRAKSFVVFKDRTGADRWIARTTTAYRDRDQEIIAAGALDQDSQRMMATKQFGPLRWWHVGAPDPLDVAAPWGPGLDIGDCDFSMLIGRTRVESGTFKSAALAAQVARVADELEMSPGFFHPLTEPTPDGVFHAIRTFERSVVPTRYGRASNLFTGFTVKESRMDFSEMERRFKTAITELGLTPDQAATLGQQLIQTEKAATEQGIAFKSEPADPWQAVTAALKAALAPPVVVNVAPSVSAADPAAVAQALTEKAAPPPPPPAAEEMPPVEAKADGDLAMLDETEPDSDEMDMDVIGNMSWDEFAAKLADLLAPVLKMQDMVKSIGDMHGELKTMYGGATTKESGNAAEIAALKEQQTAIARQLAELQGDQPAVTMPADIEAALKSAGPAVPADPSKPTVPDRPFAALASQTAPWLYSENGWQQSPPPQTN